MADESLTEVTTDGQTLKAIAKIEDPARREMCMGVFKTFCPPGKDMVLIKDIESPSLNFGPGKASLLKTLADMDFNGDGFVEESEWELYFATIGAALSDAELKIVLEELETAGSHIASINELTSIAEAMKLEGGPTGDPDLDTPVGVTLTDAQKALIEKLFVAWDFDGNGKISLEKMQSQQVKVGPMVAKVFADFELMDFNGDGVVEMDEMLLYFSLAAKEFAYPEAFEETVTKMMDVASNEQTVKDLMTFVGGLPTDDGDDAEAGELEAPKPLSAERSELVTQLFKAYSPDGSPIELSSLTTLGGVKAGPGQTQVLDSLKIMDANNDEKVELDEMLLYFTVVGSDLLDVEFNAVLAELTAAGRHANIIKDAMKFEFE